MVPTRENAARAGETLAAELGKLRPPAQLELGPLALTRAKCAEGSLHEQIAKQWTNVRSFVIKDGHLFLSLIADGGTYEFTPVADKKP